MANHHQPGGNRPHHPLWGLVNTPLRLLATVLIALLLLSMISPILGIMVMNHIAAALMPFVGIIAFGIVVWIGFTTMLRGGRGHNRNNRNDH